MGYADIPNLYKAQEILLFRRCYALEKLHGTSAHVRWVDGKVGFFSGGEKHERFVELFNIDVLTFGFLASFGADVNVRVHGEAYGGKQQGMSATYGSVLKFAAFDVLVGDSWLSTPMAEAVVTSLGLEFVHYVEVATDIDALNAERDADSIQAIRNGIGPGKMREGVVLRPPIEVVMNNGRRICAKHKREEFQERKRTPRVEDASKAEVLTRATAIADEWVVPMRLDHVLQELPHAVGIEHTGEIIKAMIADVYKEAKGEIVESKEVASAIGRKAAALWKARIKAVLS